MCKIKELVNLKCYISKTIQLNMPRTIFDVMLIFLSIFTRIVLDKRNITLFLFISKHNIVEFLTIETIMESFLNTITNIKFKVDMSNLSEVT